MARVAADQPQPGDSTPTTTTTQLLSILYQYGARTSAEPKIKHAVSVDGRGIPLIDIVSLLQCGSSHPHLHKSISYQFLPLGMLV